VVELRILGTLQLSASDGRDLDALARQSKRTALLCYLAAAVPNGLHRRDTLLALFWPELDESRARAALSQALYVLRNELGEQAIVTRGDGEVGLSGDVVWCDVRAFEAALDAGRHAEALTLYRGGLLDGFFVSDAPDFERWAERERERLRERAAEGAWALAEARAAAKDVSQAVRWARWAAALAPADEAVIRRLMTFLHGLGDRAAALRAYEAFAFRLTQEYELEPSAETQALAEAIRRERPSATPAAIPHLPPASGPAPSPEPARPRRPRFMAPALGVAIVLATLGLGVVAQHRSATASTFRHIAVLPLANLTGDTAQEYFVEGMHDALITELARIGALGVISRSSVLGYRNTTKGVPEIARELHVDAIVEGSVVVAGDSVRINAQLIEASTDKHLWAASFVKNRRHVLALYGDVAQAIAREVRAAVTPEERARLTNYRPVDPQANDLFVRGRYYCQQFTTDGFNRGIAFFRRAIDQDPTFALAYAWLSTCYAAQISMGYASTTETNPLAKATALRALELDSTLGMPYVTLGYVRLITELDFDGPDRDFRRAVELSPGSSWIRSWYADYLTFAGRFDEAQRQRQRAIDLDPLDVSTSAGLGWEYFMAHRYDEAIAQQQRTLRVEPGYWLALDLLSLDYSAKGMHEAAVAQCDALMTTDPIDSGDCGWVYARAGRRQKALEILRRLTSPSHERGPDVMGACWVYLGLGDRDHAIEWLRRAVREHSQFLVFLKGHPMLDPLRSDPRFQALLRELGIPS
jgi:DNA-binding SARP family transcriptional activator/TolB-like protein